jgi:hypothetical protein
MTKMSFNDKSKNNNQYGIQFDPQEYIAYLDGMELTDEQAEAVLAALWGVMVQFVDLGFQVDVGLNKNTATTDVKSSTGDRQHPAIKKGDGP